MKAFLTTCALALLGLQAVAQTPAAPVFKSNCEDHWSNNGNKGYCEVRDVTLAASGAGQTLTIDGQRNGGITVHGWDGPDVRVRARVQSWAKSDAAAQQQVKAVKINTSGNTLKAEGGNDNDNWAVNYEVFVPRRTALALSTYNGGISIEGVQAAVSFEAYNGGINLADLGGDVRGTTKNGGVNVTLTGTKWEGKGLDVTTTNGGINWRIPKTYSAQLKTATQHGGLNTDYPITVTGKIGRSLDTKLGEGGALVSVTTTNGGINLRSSSMEGMRKL
ncbi:hypothetical protein J0X19_15025 [Hymenobacter sp. BT186]|uniref:DUF4097 domain-containing protein n=1 Tax=Hymenobacter telluris TaxID=2816474 RepID=A0A939F0M5_9BACT|nr:DUF4097 family beta strand repeat-containing protein [Hymenobacter telluris]MBO0359273.1 hypothetical protein [Hymenobacter telluris]MBW3375299.1 DUF4097 domain-containing protein [Hymenobacter norwichensis]